MRSNVPNLNDVAEAAGVSKSTVSRVLNNKIGNGFSVTEELRQRVLRIAKKLNYRPNLIAKSLTKQNTQMISILGGAHALSNLGNIYQTVVNNITEIIDSSDQNYDVTVDMSKHRPDSSELPAWRIDGAIILAESTDTTFKQLAQMQTPYVVINGPDPLKGFSVIPDDIDGTKLAMEHLLQLGHSKIAYAGPPVGRLAGHRSIMDRYNTYISEMKNAGFEPILGDKEFIESAEEFIESTVIKNSATAILAYGHMGGLNLMQAAHKLGIAVPERLSLICFCDEYANSIMSPGLTFIDLRMRDMGKVATELLLNRIEGSIKTPPGCIKLDEKLILRNSTSPPII